MKLFFIISIPYLAIAAMFLWCGVKMQRRILDSKIGRRHPERFKDPLWLLVVTSLLWPFMIVGTIVYIFRENM